MSAADLSPKPYFDDIEGHIPDASELFVSPNEFLQNATPNQLGSSLGEGVYADPHSVQAQRIALQDMVELGRTGFSPQDRERIGQRTALERSVARGRESALQQNLADRGQLSPQAIAASGMASQQGGANVAAERERELQAMSEQRALQAMAQAGQMGSQMRGQSFDESAARAGARDAFSQANAEAMNSSRAFNAGMRNTLSQFNAQNPERLFGMQTRAHQAHLDDDRRVGDEMKRRAKRRKDYVQGGLKTGVGAFGTLVGGAVGGPGGAAAGGAIGGEVGDEVGDAIT